MTEEARLVRKKRSRAGHRASATRILDQATAALEAEDVDADRLTMLKMMLDEKRETLKTLDSEVAELVPDEELENEIHRVDEYKERIYGVLTKLNKALVLATAGMLYPTAAGRTAPADPPPADRTPPPVDRTVERPPVAVDPTPADRTVERPPILRPDATRPTDHEGEVAQDISPTF